MTAEWWERPEGVGDAQQRGTALSQGFAESRWGERSSVPGFMKAFSDSKRKKENGVQGASRGTGVGQKKEKTVLFHGYFIEKEKNSTVTCFLIIVYLVLRTVNLTALVFRLSSGEIQLYQSPHDLEEST